MTNVAGTNQESGTLTGFRAGVGTTLAVRTPRGLVRLCAIQAARPAVPSICVRRCLGAGDVASGLPSSAPDSSASAVNRTIRSLRG
jgi:hypothetical protein